MKKILVPGFFILSLLLTLLVTTSVATLRLKDGEVEFKTLEHTLTDTEIDYANRNKLYDSKIIVEQGFQNIRKDEIKITRTKNIIGWEEKVDTLKSYVNHVECNCN